MIEHIVQKVETLSVILNLYTIKNNCLILSDIKACEVGNFKIVKFLI